MIGKEIANYRITELLGEGGMGVVYKAIDLNLDRAVAIKVLNSDLVRNPELVERFRAEARAQANLNHTNLATLYSFLVQDGTAMMVMEYVDGETLEKMVRRRGPIPSQEAIPIFKQALLGIGHAHRMGIIHRDLKPSNLMLGRNGLVKVMDFGIAKVMGTQGMTRTGTQMGTAFYMSPEQVLNKPVDIRSDIYSLGVTLYELLTCHVPFEADSDYQIMTSHVTAPPPLPTRFYPYIPKGVENAVLRAMEKNPDARFQTVEEFGQALEHPEDYVASVVAPVVAPAAASAGRTVLEGATRLTPVPGDAAATRALTTVPEPIQEETHGLQGVFASKKGWVALGAAGLVLVGVLVFALRRPKPVPPVPTPNPSGPIGQNITPTPPQPGPNQNIVDSGTTGGTPETQPEQAPAAQTKPKRTSQPAAAQKTASASGGATTAGTQTAASQGETQGAGGGTTAPAKAPQVASIPAGSTVAVRMIDGINAQQSQPGQNFHASIETPVVVGDAVAIPKGSDALVQLVSSTTAGHFKGRPSVTVKLVQVSVHGRTYPVLSQTYVAQGSSRGKRSAEVMGGASAVGAAIGGVFGHKKKKDAAVGGAAGAGAGAAVQGATNPEEVPLAPEAVVQFVLASPLGITLPQ
jgi:serine/threonine-protein kinase